MPEYGALSYDPTHTTYWDKAASGVSAKIMTKSPFDIRHGHLLDVIGTPITHKGVTLVPAEVGLEGTVFTPVFPLLDWCQLNWQQIPRIMNCEENAPWVLGRLMALLTRKTSQKQSVPRKHVWRLRFSLF